MIKYMLDTDICSYIMRERPRHVLERFETLKMDQFCLSIVSYAEFIFGIQRSANPEKHQAVVDQFILHVDILPWGRTAAAHYGQIRADLEAQGNTIGNMDMMIAAHARSQDMILVTNNEKHFQRVSALTIENWRK